jgi:hypothetical protein
MTELLTVCLMRPIRMFAEPLVLFTDLFLLYQYSIYFLAFQAYPIIFKGQLPLLIQSLCKRYLPMAYELTPAQAPTT